MPVISDLMRVLKIHYFLKRIPKNANILEIGSGDRQIGIYLKKNGWKHYIGLDITPPADIVGDIRDWKALGLKPASFDVIIAFEVVEHIDCLRECHLLLKKGGTLMMTSPWPPMDKLMLLLEKLNLNRRRTSPHDCLIYFNDITQFRKKNVIIFALSSQWGIFWK